MNYFTETESFIRGTIYFDEQSQHILDYISADIDDNNISVLSKPANAEYVVISNPNTDIMNYLSRNQTVIFETSLNFSKVQRIPSYALKNMVRIGDGQERETIVKMIKFRNVKEIKTSLVMSVESKLDIWMNF